MIELKRSIVIAATPEEVFDLVDDTANLPQVWRNLSNIRDLKRLPNGGHSFRFDYTMAGISIQGASADLEHDRPRRIVTRTTGGVNSTITWEFRPLADGKETELCLGGAYEVPVPLVGRLAEVIVAKVNETDIVYVLNYVKLKLEGGES